MVALFCSFGHPVGCPLAKLGASGPKKGKHHKSSSSARLGQCSLARKVSHT